MNSNHLQTLLEFKRLIQNQLNNQIIFLESKDSNKEQTFLKDANYSHLLMIYLLLSNFEDVQDPDHNGPRDTHSNETEHGALDSFLEKVDQDYQRIIKILMSKI